MNHLGGISATQEEGMYCLAIFNNMVLFIHFSIIIENTHFIHSYIENVKFILFTINIVIKTKQINVIKTK